jgi:hypothetical protein
MESVDEPTYKQAMNGPERTLWKTALDEHYRSLLLNEAWTLVELPSGRKIVRGKWVLKRKRDEHGNISEYKARWVVDGARMVEGLDYTEVFAGTVFKVSTRVAIAVGINSGYLAFHFDVSGAYLQAPILEDVFMMQITGFEDDQQGSKVCKLAKAVPGTKQGGNAWQKERNTKLAKIGFRQLMTDTCIYVRANIILVVYVDDILALCKSKEVKNDLFKELSALWKMKDLGLWLLSLSDGK